MDPRICFGNEALSSMVCTILINLSVVKILSCSNETCFGELILIFSPSFLLILKMDERSSLIEKALRYMVC